MTVQHKKKSIVLFILLVFTLFHVTPPISLAEPSMEQTKEMNGENYYISEIDEAETTEAELLCPEETAGDDLDEADLVIDNSPKELDDCTNDDTKVETDGTENEETELDESKQSSEPINKETDDKELNTEIDEQENAEELDETTNENNSETIKTANEEQQNPNSKESTDGETENNSELNLNENDEVDETEIDEQENQDELSGEIQLFRAAVQEIELKRGVYEEKVIDIKQNLNKLGYTSFKNPNNYFGTKTEKGIKAFQKDYGIPVTGVADEATISKMEEVLSSPLQRGKSHEDAIEVKKKLTILGYENFKNPTKYYGVRTEAAVKQFQKDMGLPVTGIVDQATMKLLKEQADKPLSKGMRRADAVELKQNLDKLGFASFKNPNNYFGTKTEKGIKAFQKQYGLPVTGVADEETLSKMEEILSSPLQRGKSSTDAIDLKKKLTILGYENFKNPTKYYGVRTEAAVKQFQKDMGLPVTGIVDQATMKLLKEQADKPLSKGMRRADAVELKQNLDKLGFASFKNPNNYFGTKTEKGIKAFQKHYGLPVTGIANLATLNKMEEVLSSPLQRGKSHSDTIDLKKKLTILGYENFKKPTKYYGVRTETAIKQFQKDMGLPVSGIADKKTIEKLKEQAIKPLAKGMRRADAVELKQKLNELGFATFKNPNNYFGTKTEKGVKDFQRTYGLPVTGVADKKTLEEIDKAINLRSYTEYNITLDQAVAIQMKANPQTDQNYAYVSKKYIKNNKVTASALNVRKGPSTSKDSIGLLYKGDRVKILGEYNGWYQIEYQSNAWKDAAPKDVRYYLDPNNFLNDRRLSFQFLDLSKPSYAKASELNKYLKGKGTLEGMGQAFIDASKKHGINDLYLLSHAILETGHGQSELAQGVKVKGKTVYNMFGIGAYDNCAVKCGAERAYEEGWFTPYDAIVGGAKFIGNSYIKAGQNTLYKMRWNPEAMEQYGYATHQYATDIGWAAKQVTSMYNMYKNLGIYHLVLDIPKFK